MKRILKNRGLALIEMIVYVTVLATVFILVVNTLLVITSSYSSVKATNELNNSALISLDRLVREIRSADSIDIAQSIFDANPGRLVLNTTDISENLLTLDFYVEDNDLKLKKDGILSGALNLNNVDVTNLIFTNTSATTSLSVRIEMTLSSSIGNITKVEKFYSSAVLRGSY